MTPIVPKYHLLRFFRDFNEGITSGIRNITYAMPSQLIKTSLLAYSYKNGDDLVDYVRQNGGDAHIMTDLKQIGFLSWQKFLDKFFSDNHFDILHCHIDGWQSGVVAYYARKHGVKLCAIHAHRSVEEDSQCSRIKQFINRYSSIHCFDLHFACNKVATSCVYGEKSLKDVYYLRNGLDISKYTYTLNNSQIESYNELFGIKKGQIVIGHIGRFSPIKNHKFLLQLASSMLSKQISFKMLFIGDGNDIDLVKNQVLELGLSDNVEFLGYRQDIINLLKYMDVLLLPSFAEALSNVSIEVQAAGTPAILSDTIKTDCDLGLNTVQFKPLVADVWEEAILSVINKKESSVNEIKSHFIESGFDSGSIAKYYFSILDEAITKKKNV
ncbi:MAG: glycosyltransferase [Bacteroidia bacterium]|nr:glycosyltransferase [Bacteroidia bacterium]